MDIQRLVLKADAHAHDGVKSLAPEVLFRYSGEGMRTGTTLTVEAASLPESGCSVAVSGTTRKPNITRDWPASSNSSPPESGSAGRAIECRPEDNFSLSPGNFFAVIPLYRMYRQCRNR